MRKHKIAGICLKILILLVSLSDKGSAETGAEILNIIPDARVVAMGGAFTSLAEDSGSVFSNPAGLGDITHVEIPVGRNYLFQDMDEFFGKTQQEYYALAYSLRDIYMSNVVCPGTLFISFNRIGDKYIPGHDESGLPSDNYAEGGRVITGSYGKNIMDLYSGGKILAGFSVKFYKEEMPEYIAEGYAYDLGVICKNFYRSISLGISFQNIGQDSEYLSEKYELPYRNSIGISGKFLNDALILAGDLSSSFDSGVSGKLGAELWLMDTIALRSGYNDEINPENGLTGGIGISLKDIDAYCIYVRELTFDYALPTQGDLEDEHRFSIKLKLGVD
jgi:hypothetical protein